MEKGLVGGRMGSLQSRRQMQLVVAAVGLVLLGAAVAGLLVPAPSSPVGPLPPVGAEVGDRAPEVQAVTLAGTPVRLTSLRGRTVVLAFWATWCTACQQELPLLDQLARQHPEMRIVTIESDGSRTAVVAAMRQLHLVNVSVWRDPTGETLRTHYDTHAIPATFVIDGSGRIANSFLGATESEGDLELALFGTRSAVY